MNLLKILDGTPEPPIIDLEIDKENLSGVYTLATPMYEFQKELTDQIVSLHYSDILKYFETDDKSDLIIKSLEICIENASLVSSHPYLLISHYMPKNLAQKDMSNKLAETSGKFNVLRDLINVIIKNPLSKNKNIGIVMKNNTKYFDLVDALLLGTNGPRLIKRYVGNNVKKESSRNDKQEEGKPQIHLIPNDGILQRNSENFEEIKFDTLIVFDSHVDTNSAFFKQLRHQNREHSCVIIHLVPLKTVEHCQLHYADDFGKEEYLPKVISSIVCLRDFIGNLPPDIFPIYNKKLSYLSGRFFNILFGSETKENVYPTWPLPDLPLIPRFSATDVERSLLTEVHFHYTPYDSDSHLDGDLNQKKKPSFYETRRLELNYVSNPLKNDYNTLIGIHSVGETHKSDINSKMLTHKLIMTLNELYPQQKLVEDELAAYESYHDDEDFPRANTRGLDLKNTLAALIDEIEHVESRFATAEKLSERKVKEIESVKSHVDSATEEVKDYEIKHNIVSEKKKEFIRNQLEIWELQDAVKNMVDKIKAKNEEKGYSNEALNGSSKSIHDSERQIVAIKSEIQDKKRTLAEVIQKEEEENEKFRGKRKKLLSSLRDEQTRNRGLQTKLDKSLKFLNDTSHLKKRKARGVTPNIK